MKLQDTKPLPDMKLIIGINHLNMRLQDTKHLNTKCLDTNHLNNNTSLINHHSILIITIIKDKLIINQLNIFKPQYTNHSQFIMYLVLNQLSQLPCHHSKIINLLMNQKRITRSLLLLIKHLIVLIMTIKAKVLMDQVFLIRITKVLLFINLTIAQELGTIMEISLLQRFLPSSKAKIEKILLKLESQ